MTRRKPEWTDAERARLAEVYGTTDAHEATRLLNAEFGNGRTEAAVYAKAQQMGLHRPVENPAGKPRARRVERVIRWSREPEMSAWMAENDTGSIPAVQRRFRERFGFGIASTQVSAYRAAHGTQRRRDNDAAHDHNRRPIGYERDTGKGYVLVKVAERPNVPGSKDNWRMKHVLAWEEANGRPLPDGCEVLFADRDHSNYDPANLVAVPKALVGILNTKDFPAYRDRESLDACIALAELQSGIVDAANAPRKCQRCGRTFVPRDRESSAAKTCPDCVDAGHKAGKPSAFAPEMDAWLRSFYPSHGIAATLDAWPFEGYKPTASTLSSHVSRIGLKRER